MDVAADDPFELPLRGIAEFLAAPEGVVAIEGDHADLVGHRCIMPRREKAKPAWAPASRRVLSAGGRCSLGRTSCPDGGARHPWRACRGPRPPGHGPPRNQYRRFGCERAEARRGRSADPRKTGGETGGER